MGHDQTRKIGGKYQAIRPKIESGITLSTRLRSTKIKIRT
jgi:hypothetical protein